MNTQICAVCQHAYGFRWTDTHGIGACVHCGAPYRLYHYENDQRVERPPELMLAAWFVPFARRYWAEHHRNCDPGAYNFPGSSYEVATHADFAAFGDWVNQNRGAIKAAQDSDKAADGAR